MSSRHAEIAERVKEILLADPAAQVGVAGLASAVACSPHHLCRLFRLHTGWSLHQFRNQARLRLALELLPQHRGDLTELALELGYSSHSHFSAAFRAAFGRRPSHLIRDHDRRRELSPAAPESSPRRPARVA